MEIEQHTLDRLNEIISDSIEIKSQRLETFYVRDLQLTSIEVQSSRVLSDLELENLRTAFAFLKSAVSRLKEDTVLLVFFTGNLTYNFNDIIEKVNDLEQEVFVEQTSFMITEDIQSVSKMFIKAIEGFKAVKSVFQMNDLLAIKLGNSHLIRQDLELLLIDSFDLLENKETLSYEVFKQMNYLLKRLNGVFVDFEFNNNKISTVFYFSL